MTALKSVRQLHAWNRRVLSIGGLWPLEPSFVKFYIGFVYFISHFIMALCDLVSVFGDMTLMIANLTETSVQAMVGVKMLILRHSSSLARVMRQVENGAKEGNYRDEEEKSSYLEYNRIGRRFFLVLGYLSFSTVLMYHLKPLEDIMKAVFHNNTMPYILPYRTRMFFDISDARTYALVYILQTPMFYYYYCHTISVCFLCTLIVHVAGELSVLAHRIRRINALSSTNEYRDPKIAFRDAVIKHQSIIRTAELIDEVFRIVLLEELVISTMLIGLTAYNVLAKSVMVSMFEYFSFVTYSVAMIGLIFVYCVTGDFLIRECANVRNAYYECRWYAMPWKYRKYMLICMIRAESPLQLTAGHFYVFSLKRFGSVLKAALAYISMLRTVV